MQTRTTLEATTLWIAKSLVTELTAWKLAACLPVKELFQAISEQSYCIKKTQVLAEYSQGFQSNFVSSV